MSQGCRKDVINHTALVAALAFGVTLGVIGPAVAHEREDMCGPVVDADGEAVMQGGGNILMHSGSFPCPPEEVTPEPFAIEPVSTTVLFDFDVDIPNDEGEAALQGIIAELQDRTPDRVHVDGHADRAGPEVYNQDLSQRRANNVAKRLIAGGIQASSVTIEAFGETDPAVPTDDGVREPANRRVEIEADFSD